VQTPDIERAKIASSAVIYLTAARSLHNCTIKRRLSCLPCNVFSCSNYSIVYTIFDTEIEAPSCFILSLNFVLIVYACVCLYLFCFFIAYIYYCLNFKFRVFYKFSV
jgi:hypothetical protein